jgi:hypothetical protein
VPVRTKHKSEQIPSLVSGPSHPLAEAELQNLTSVIRNALQEYIQTTPFQSLPQTIEQNQTRSIGTEAKHGLIPRSSSE